MLRTPVETEVLQILREAIDALESPKARVSTAVQKLLRAAHMLDDKDLIKWCEIQLGDTQYTVSLNNYASAFYNAINEVYTKMQRGKPFEETREFEKNRAAMQAAAKEIEKLGLVQDLHYPVEELRVRAVPGGGGYKSISFLEDRYAELVRNARGSDGTYNKTDVHTTIDYVRRSAYERAIAIYNKLAFSAAPQTSFGLLKSAVDDKLLDLAPDLAERLMIAFSRLTNDSPEEWSQALTSCRRILEGLADVLYPPSESSTSGRNLGKAQYINRIWAFMDQAIASDSNRALAKAHVDYLGSYIERVHKVSNKGVHASVTRIEATKAIFHTYLVVADLLEYLDQTQASPDTQKLNIHTASLEEIETILEVKRAIAKEIVKLRVERGTLSSDLLKSIPGLGPKTMERAKSLFDFTPAARAD